MDAEARYTLIGAVVITLSVFLTAFGFWLGTNKPESEYNFYTVYFRNQTLDGLQKNSDLTMKGIKVGSVEDFSILDNDVERVRVLVRVLRGIPIKQGAEAVIRRNFLTGLAYIDIRNAKQDASILTERLPGERHPIIAEGRTGLDEIADTIPDLVKDLRRFVSEVLSEENRDSIRLTLANIKEFSEALNKK
ncbi:MCE family protein [bacterium]|nr:MCE family protein [bacterium]